MDSKPKSGCAGIIALALVIASLSITLACQNPMELAPEDQGPGASTSPLLASLSSPTGSFSPPFSPDVSEYDLSVSWDQGTVSITAAPAEESHSVLIAGEVPDSANTVSAIPLDPGATTLEVEVTSPSQTRAYLVRVLRSRNAVYVSPRGNDTNPGTIEEPKRSLSAAIAAAPVGGVVYAAAGTYTQGVIELVSGVSLFGGFDSLTWTRSDAQETIIRHEGSVSSGRIIGLMGQNLTSQTVVDGVRVETPDASGESVVNYGIYCNGCVSLELRSVQVIAGAGGDGSNGENGHNGDNGADGADGAHPNGDGACRDNSLGGVGGTGGMSPFGRAGGAGGRGGDSGGFGGGGTEYDGADGEHGYPLGQSDPFGDPGTGTVESSSGSDPGGTGKAGVAGAHGSNGNTDSPSVVGGYWLVGSPGGGTDGEHGGGGGGGGGSGAYTGMTVNNGPGNGGGGGGAGGQAGTGGSPGSSGGASFGLFLVNSGGVVISNSEFTSGRGGDGGQGGTGGLGGKGGLAGAGSAACSSYVGAGGSGGVGGDGGDGGHGAGGNGGSSYAVYRFNTPVSLDGSSLTAGAAGKAGTSAGNDGIAGVSAPTN
jgi:hypothetical protein